MSGIGIDVESHRALAPGALDLISSVDERRRLQLLAGAHPGIHWDRILFSAKEATYKAWFPLTRLWLDFDDVELDISPGTSTFGAWLSIPGRPMLTGRFLVRDGLIATAIALPS